MKCGAWRVQCEVWSVKEAVGSEKCEVWSVKFQFGVRRAQCEVWSVRFGVWRKQWEVRSVKCEVWSVKFGVGRKQWEVRSVKCGLWSVECEVRSEKWEVWSEKCECGLWSVECEVRSEKCEVWSLECEGSSEKWEVWNVECEVWSVKCEVRSVDCEVWSVKCGLWSVKCDVWTVKCEVCSVKCEVWGLECEGSSEKWEVWSVKCGVWSLKFGVRRVQCAVWGVECRGKDTVGTGCLWTIGHLCLGNFRRRLARVYVNTCYLPITTAPALFTLQFINHFRLLGIIQPCWPGWHSLLPSPHPRSRFLLRDLYHVVKPIWNLHWGWFIVGFTMVYHVKPMTQEVLTFEIVLPKRWTTQMQIQEKTTDKWKSSLPSQRDLVTITSWYQCQYPNAFLPIAAEKNTKTSWQLWCHIFVDQPIESVQIPSGNTGFSVSETTHTIKTKKTSNSTRMSESAVPLVPNGQLVFLDWHLEDAFCLVSSHHKTTEIGLPSCFCPYRMGNISHKPEIQRSVFVCLFCWHVPCNVIQPNINHTYMCRLLGCTVIVQQKRSLCFSGISSPSSKYSSVWHYSLIKFQWLGVRQHLQETPIFHGKIPWSSLSIFPWTIPLIWVNYNIFTNLN